MSNPKFPPHIASGIMVYGAPPIDDGARWPEVQPDPEEIRQFFGPTFGVCPKCNRHALANGPCPFCFATALIERMSAPEGEEFLRVERELKAVTANLTDVQTTCTAQLLELRRLRMFAPLADAIARARGKHPKGCDLRSLVEEIGEVASAMRRESPTRVREELLDVCVVAFRLYIGEQCE